MTWYNLSCVYCGACVLQPLVIKNARGIPLYLEDAILVKEPMAFKVRPGTFLNCVYYGACVLCPLIIKNVSGQVSDGLAYHDAFGGARRVIGVLTYVQLLVCGFNVSPDVECVCAVLWGGLGALFHTLLHLKILSHFDFSHR